MDGTKQHYSFLRVFAAGFTLLSFFLQAVPATAQTSRNQRTVADEASSSADLNSSKRQKIAPDLEDETNELLYGLRSDEVRNVIIQLNPSSSINEMFGNELSSGEVKQMFSVEAAENKIKARDVKSKLIASNGEFKKSFNNIGLVSARLPLSRIRELMESDAVEYISPDREMYMNGHIENTTGASLVRNLVSATTPLDGRGIGVAILDTGVDGSHLLLGAASSEGRPGVVLQKDFSSTDPYANPYDYYGHGSHVATMLAGRSSNSSYRGIAPNVKILSLRVLNENGIGLASNVIAALDWCITNKTTYNIRIINISLGTPPKDSYRNDPLCLAVRRAVNAGIVVIASAGNNGKDANGRKQFGTINSPGIEPSAITVGALNTFGTDLRSDDAVASFSSKGPTRGYRTISGVRYYDNLVKPDIVAPGNKLIGALSTQQDSVTGQMTNTYIARTYTSLVTTPIYQNDPWSKMMYLSGTSMAAPVVSGTVALMLQAKPNLTPNHIKAILMYSAQPLKGVSTLEQGAGSLNVDGALRITKLVKSNITKTNGTAMLSSALPVSQTSTIAGQPIYWGKGVITNYGFLYGEDLMKKWQGMYGTGVLISDSTPFSGSLISRSTTLTSGTLSLYQGAIKNNGVLIGDGSLFLSSFAMGSSPAPFMNSQGVLVSDGVLIGDGVLIADGVLIGDGVLISDGNPVVQQTLLGDNTTGMLPGQ